MGTMSLQTSHRVVSAVFHFLGVSILAHLISRRATLEDWRSFDGWRRLFSSVPRLLILNVLIWAWAQLVIGGILILGIGLDGDVQLCTSAITLCFTFYCTSQACMFVFFIEKVHVVWNPLQRKLRRYSPVYYLCTASLVGYMSLFLVAAIRRMSRLNHDGNCEIAIHTDMIAPIIAVGIYMHILFTTLFVWSLMQHTLSGSFLRNIAWRSLIASVIGLASTTANAVVLIVRKEELAWICIGSCGADLIVNAIVVFWASSEPLQQSSQPSQGTKKGTVSMITFNHHLQPPKPLVTTFTPGDLLDEEYLKDPAVHCVRLPEPNQNHFSHAGVSGTSSNTYANSPSSFERDQTASFAIPEAERPARRSW